MKEYESPGLDEDNFIMNLIKKHDPEEKLYFSREQYKNLLIDVVIQGILETEGKIDPKDETIIKDSLTQFIQATYPNSEKPEISYKALMVDLQGALFDFYLKNIEDPKVKEAAVILFGQEALDMLIQQQKEQEEKEENKKSVNKNKSDQKVIESDDL